MMPYTEKYIRELQIQRRLFLVLNICAALSISGLVYLWVSQRDDIQRQRYQNILRSCEDQNNRRANTISILNREILGLPPKERTRAEANETYTIALINALAPHQDCLSLARSATGGQGN